MSTVQTKSKLSTADLRAEAATMGAAHVEFR